MPTGPQGQKRSGDAIGLAVLVGRIATGEIDETDCMPLESSKAGQAGGNARATKLTADRRREIANGAAAARWR